MEDEIASSKGKEKLEQYLNINSTIPFGFFSLSFMILQVFMVVISNNHISGTNERIFMIDISYERELKAVLY